MHVGVVKSESGEQANPAILSSEIIHTPRKLRYELVDPSEICAKVGIVALQAVQARQFYRFGYGYVQQEADAKKECQIHNGNELQCTAGDLNLSGPAGSVRHDDDRPRALIHDQSSLPPNS
jgi:hypothetical protein